MLHKILIPLDGSKLAEAAIPYALDLIGSRQGEVLLFRVAQYEEVLVPPQTMFDTYQLGMTNSRQVKEADAYLCAVAAGIQRENIKVTTLVETVKQGVADEILATADAGAFDAIVLTTNGRSGFRQLLMGSIAKEILSKAKRTVFAIKVAAQAEDDASFFQINPSLTTMAL